MCKLVMTRPPLFRLTCLNRPCPTCVEWGFVMRCISSKMRDYAWITKESVP